MSGARRPGLPVPPERTASELDTRIGSLLQLIACTPQSQEMKRHARGSGGDLIELFQPASR